ncbi:MAG TPA: trypsin-like serine protease [Verrucomicrobiales bacterium]|nr:trypsin-like serine protease [Verrucomicrobiales bacterium]
MKCFRTNGASFGLAILFGLIAGTSPVEAVVVVDETDGSQINTSAPSNDPGFESVVRVYRAAGSPDASGVYLGQGWVLTADHVGKSDSLVEFDISGSVFSVPVIQTMEPAAGVDLELLRFDIASLGVAEATLLSSLSPVSLSSSTAGTGAADEFMMIGYGRSGTVTPKAYDIDTAPDPDLWSDRSVNPPDGVPEALAVQWGGAKQKQWGTNASAGTLAISYTVEGQPTINPAILTLFDGGDPDEGQGVPGDSGGALFFDNGVNWELAGIMVAISQFDGNALLDGAPLEDVLPALLDGQPSSSLAVYDYFGFPGSVTYSVNLSVFHDEILAIIPEPASGGLVLSGLLAFWVRRRRSGRG